MDELLKANILSKDEFETKKKQLYKKHYEKIVNEMPHLNPDNSHQIETISKYSFKPAQQRRIADLEQNLQKGDVIIADKESKNKYYICKQNRFNTFLNSDAWSWNKYIYVDLHIEDKNT